MKRSILGLTAGLLLSSAVQANEPAAAPAQPLSEKVAICAACHGPNGVSANPMYPSLAGQYADYLEAALQAYKAGARKNPIMAAQADFLSRQSDAEIAAIARYFAAQKGPLYTPALK